MPNIDYKTKAALTYLEWLSGVAAYVKSKGYNPKNIQGYSKEEAKREYEEGIAYDEFGRDLIRQQREEP